MTAPLRIGLPGAARISERSVVKHVLSEKPFASNGAAYLAAGFTPKPGIGL